MVRIMPELIDAKTPTFQSDVNKRRGSASGAGAFRAGSRIRKRSYSFTEGRTGENSTKRWFERPRRPPAVAASAGKSATTSATATVASASMGKSGSLFKANNVLPSKFLLGGNIRDPLNLNSLSDERISRAVNAVTPESSPLPTPKHRKAEYKIEVLIPPNISDPLNLNCNVDEGEYEKQLISPAAGGNAAQQQRRYKAKYHRKRARSGKDGVDGKKGEDDEGTQSDPGDAAADYSGPSQIKKMRQEALKEAGAGSSVVDGGSESDSALLAVATAEKKKSKKPSPLVMKAQPIAAKIGDVNKKASPASFGEIVSPVVPQAGQRNNSKKRQQFKFNQSKHQQGQNRRKRRGNGGVNIGGGGKAKANKDSGKGKQFQYGNYSRYYGYRNLGGELDTRLQLLQADWFAGKDVLDVGCNTGELTMALAKQFRPRSIVGMDIDRKLVDQARRNAKLCLSCRRPGEDLDFPKNLPLIFGHRHPPGEGNIYEADDEDETQQSGERKVEDNFPRNVRFICGNYVVDNDDLLETTQPEFDAIVCFSTTKWIHLNFGDDGIKRTFKRMYAQLRPGGVLVLEPQAFHTYRRRKRINEVIFENFENIKLRPEQFPDYLVHVVGFLAGGVLGVPGHSAKGFRRPIQVFVKPGQGSARTVNSSVRSTPLVPSAAASSVYQRSSSYYGGPSPGVGGGGSASRDPRLYAPSLTPRYQPSPSPVHAGGDAASTAATAVAVSVKSSPKAGPSKPMEDPSKKERPVAVVKPQPPSAHQSPEWEESVDDDEDENDEDENDEDEEDQEEDQEEDGQEEEEDANDDTNENEAEESEREEESQREEDHEEEAPSATPAAGEEVEEGEGQNEDNANEQAFSPYDGYYLGATPNYSPGEAAPAYSGYSGYTPGRSGITPGYTGPSPDHAPSADGGPGPSGPGHSPVYTGPDPGVLSNASTPGRNEEGPSAAGPSGAGYTPSYSPYYAPSNPGTPSYDPSATPTYSPTYSPGPSPSAAPSPGSAASPASPTPMQPSPQVQQAEITGNTTPHPGPSPSCSPSAGPSSEDASNRYLWYGDSSQASTPSVGVAPPAAGSSASPSYSPSDYASASPAAGAPGDSERTPSASPKSPN